MTQQQPPPPPPQQPGGYYAPPPPPPPPPGSVYLPPPSPPESNTTRNVVIAVIVALLIILLLAAVYAFSNQSPAASQPVLIPTLTPAATKTPKATPTEEPVNTEEAPTEKPTKAPQTEEPATPEPSEVASGPTAEPTDEPATEPPATEPAGPSAEPTTIPGTEDQGLVIGEPVLIGDSAFQEVALLVQNVDDQVKSYSLLGTFKSGDTITATANGFVTDHLAGTIRTPVLYIDGTPGPDDTLTVQIDTMIDEADSTETGDIAKQVTFGPPSVNLGILPAVDVEVTNGSETPADISVDVGVLRDGVLVGVGTGVVSDMSAGQTKTATLYVTGSVEATDQLMLSVSAVIPDE